MINLLLIDDDELIVEMLEYALESLPIAVHVADSISTIKKGDYDTVMRDLNLKQSRGEETLKAVREIFPNQRLIVISGVRPSGLDEWAAAYSIDTFIEKDHLIERVKTLF